MIDPVNHHILIDPVKHEAFMASQRETYQEIGIVVGFDRNLTAVRNGDKVYFDAWLAAKYPKEGGTDDDFYWLVKWEDIRAVERYVEPEPVQE